jgi:serine/threonine protein kinase
LKLPNFLSEEARSLLIALMNRNPLKRLGAGPAGAAAIKAHPFFKDLDWVAAENRQLPVPLPIVKKISEQEIPLEKVYGRGAFDEGLKDHNRLPQWSFVRKPGTGPTIE